AGGGETAGDDATATTDLADDVGVLDQVLVDKDREFVLRITLRVGNAVAGEGAEEVAAVIVERDGDVGEVCVGVGGAAGVGDHAAVDAGKHGFVAWILLGVGRLKVPESRRVRCPGLP